MQTDELWEMIAWMDEYAEDIEKRDFRIHISYLDDGELERLYDYTKDKEQWKYFHSELSRERGHRGIM